MCFCGDDHSDVDQIYEPDMTAALEVEPSHARAALFKMMLIAAAFDWGQHPDFSCRQWCFFQTWSTALLILATMMALFISDTSWTVYSLITHVIMQASAASAVAAAVAYWTISFWALPAQPSGFAGWMGALGTTIVPVIAVWIDVWVSRRVFEKRSLLLT